MPAGTDSFFCRRIANQLIKPQDHGAKLRTYIHDLPEQKFLSFLFLQRTFDREFEFNDVRQYFYIDIDIRLYMVYHWGNTSTNKHPNIMFFEK